MAAHQISKKYAKKGKKKHVFIKKHVYMSYDLFLNRISHLNKMKYFNDENV